MGSAAFGGHTGVLTCLLENGGAVDAEDRKSTTALMIAGQHGRGEAVRVLVLAGANLVALNDDGHTALTLALLEGQDAIVNLLLELGADVDLRGR